MIDLDERIQEKTLSIFKNISENENKINKISQNIKIDTENIFVI